MSAKKTVYMSRKPEGKHSSNLFASKLIDRFTTMGVNYTFHAKSKWDVGLVMISADDDSVFNRPVVQRLDGIYFNTDEKGRVSNGKIKSCYEKAAGVIFQSNLAKTIVSQNFGPPKNEHIVINNGTFIEKGEDRAFGKLQSRVPYLMKQVMKFDKRLICVAKWRAIKRLPSIVNGALEYIKSNPKACLIIVGPLELPEYNKYKKCHPNIIYAGPLKNDEVRWLQMLSHCCLNLSFTDSCPSVIVEAAAHGTPCVITKHQGVVDILTEGVDSAILDVDDWDYGPISYAKDIRDIDRKKVADAIQKCISIGRLPVRPELDMAITAKKYVDFMLKCAR